MPQSAFEKSVKAGVPVEPLRKYEELVNQFDLERKGAKNPYTSKNGHMFSFLIKDDWRLALRLPKDYLKKFLEEHQTELVVTYGTVMKEYALVPTSLMDNTEVMKKHFQVSLDYVSSLKPKATKKK